MLTTLNNRIARWSLCIVSTLLLLGTGECLHAADIEVLALFRDQAVIRVDGQRYKLKAGETTPDKKFTLVEARCLGSCGLAPILLLNGEVLGKETPASTLAKIKALIKNPPAKHNGHATPEKEAEA